MMKVSILIVACGLFAIQPLFGQTGPTLSGVKFITSTSAAAVGQSGTILRSNDGGVTWYNQPSGTTTSLFGLCYPTSSNGTVVGGDPINGTQAVMHTANSGSSWSSQLTGITLPLLGVSFADANNGFAVGYNGHIVHTVDGGASWTNQVTGVLTTLDNVACIDANTATIVGDFGVIMRTVNGGASWAQQASGVGADLYAVAFSSSTTGTAVGTSGTIIRTTNGGSSWVRQTSGTTNYLNAVCFIDANNGWAVGNGGVILHTANGGSSWTNQSLAIANWSDVSFIDANTGLIVGDHGTSIYRTTNGGSSWTQEFVGTTTQPPPAPMLASPASGSSGQPTSLTVSWNASAGATSYHLQASTSPTFSPLAVDQSGLTSTSFPISGLANNTTYYWHVSASNSGGTSAYSSAWNLTTVASLPSPPAAPVLASPASGSTNQPTALTLSWNASSGATSYHLQVSTSSTFSPLVVDQSALSTTSSAISGLANSTLYYWRVSASNTGGTSAYSAAWNLTTGASLPPPPAAPVLASPANGATNQPTSLTLSWNASSGATTYHLQVSTSSTFSTLFVDQSALTTTSSAISGMANSTTYYWRVSASNTGGTSAYSAAWSCATVAGTQPPAAPTLSAPAYGATGQPTSLTFSWYASTGATSYHLQVSTSSSFSTLAVDQSGLTATSSSVTGLSNGITYYWQVNASNSGGTSAYSGVWNFATVSAVQPPAAPVLASPATGATGQPTSLTLSWNASSGAASYHLQVSTSSTFSPLVVDQSALTGTSSAISGLANSTLYYWRVSASNTGGTSAWSSTWSLTTAASLPPPPPAPVLASPSNGSSNVPTSVTFAWNASSGASSYHLQASKNSSFSTVDVDQNGLTGTSSSVSGLSMSTTYYWRVCASNTGGTSPFSGMANFATIAGTPSFSVSPASYDFGGVAIGASATTTVVVTNSGTATLTISSISSTNSVYTVGSSSASIAPGGSQAISITFKPTAKNTTVNASINFVHNAPNSPGVVSVTGKNGGGKYVVSATASSISNGRPRDFSIDQNYPNPFNPTTTISYGVPEPSIVRLSVYNILGQEVATLVNGEVGAGNQSVVWNASNTAGLAIPSGIYFYTLHATSLTSGREFSESKRMMLMK
jgi:photosystem II stability/assembly factor-like uncharacterized protein